MCGGVLVLIQQEPSSQLKEAAQNRVSAHQHILLWKRGGIRTVDGTQNWLAYHKPS